STEATWACCLAAGFSPFLRAPEPRSPSEIGARRSRRSLPGDGAREMDSPSVEHPANATLCRYLERHGRLGSTPIARPDEILKPYESLGTHPDLVARLWDELAADLPADCRFVVFGAPALVRPDTGIVFGFAGGTHTYALRLPADVRQEAMLAGARSEEH